MRSSAMICPRAAVSPIGAENDCQNDYEVCPNEAYCGLSRVTPSDSSSGLALAVTV